MATFWERADHLVNSMCCLYLSVILVISHFRFEAGTVVLIASVPGHCLCFTFDLENIQTCLKACSTSLL